MGKKDIHQLIEEINSEGKESLRVKVKERLSLPVETVQEHSNPAPSPFKKHRRVFASISAALAVASLAIVLPIALNRDTVPHERYCYAADCVKTDIDYSLKDYSERNKLSLLYLDWYEVADEIQTQIFVNENNSSDIIYFQEMIVNGETGSIVTLSITDLYTKVDIFEEVKTSCESTAYISSVKVSWGYMFVKGAAYFEYSGHRYIIELVRPMAEDSVLDLVKSMLPQKK